jgi:hypothetical protein
MPNGGADICGHCKAYRKAESELTDKVEVGGRCTLRVAPVTDPYWTTCENFDLSNSVGLKSLVESRGSAGITGPMWAVDMLLGVEGLGYDRYPYFDGFRPIVHPGIGVQIVDSHGEKHIFSTNAEYLEFCKDSGRELGKSYPS